MKESFENEKKKSSIEELVNELDRLQQEKNDGRGITVIRSIISWLRQGEILRAQLEASHDHDKIRNYPDIEALLKEQLFSGEELWRWVPPKDRKEQKDH